MLHNYNGLTDWNKGFGFYGDKPLVEPRGMILVSRLLTTLTVNPKPYLDPEEPTLLPRNP